MQTEKADNAHTGRFFANTIHELRTPLQTIVGTLELLQQTDLDTEQAEHVRQLQFSSDILLSFANNILDFAKIQSGKFTIEKIPMNIIDITEQTVDLICLEAYNRGLEVVTDIDYGIFPFIRGDPIRIQQVLLNFIKNALKFTHKGYIHTRLSKTHDGRRLLFEVEDSGIGIPEENQTHLFKDFYQGHASTTRKYGGTGLGLSISKGLVDAMGGELGMRPNPSGGSVFWFSIPLEELPKEEVARRENTDKYTLPASSFPLNIRILLVDNNERALQSLCAKLKIFNRGLIDTASSGEQALAQMRNAAAQGNPYAVVFIDMIMPGMDGWYLATEINNDTSINNSKLYLIVPEGQMGGEAKMKMLDWFNGYLYKPIKFVMLKEVLLSLSATPLELEVVEHVTSGSDFSARGLKILAAEDHPVNRKLIHTFLTQFGAEVFTAEDGEDAVNLIKKYPDIDLIFMDILMPVKTGLQATIEIRALGYAGIIIACTANTDTADFNSYLSNGMNDILTKPFKRKNIADVLKKWESTLRAAQKRNGTPARNEAQNMPMPVERFLFQTGHLVRRLRGHIKKEDFTRLSAMSTLIAETSAAFSADALSEAARNLSETAHTGDVQKLYAALQTVEKEFADFKTAGAAMYAGVPT